MNTRRAARRPWTAAAAIAAATVALLSQPGAAQAAAARPGRTAPRPGAPHSLAHAPPAPGATHFATTPQIGRITVTKVENKGRQNRRVR
ncbi:hypothetical protein ACFV4F_36550, partial [Kitasatospora sp. NPDC059722]